MCEAYLRQNTQHLDQVEGFDYVALSEPNQNRRFHRVGFVQFKAGSDMEAAEQKLFESKVRSCGTCSFSAVDLFLQIDTFTLHMGRANHVSYQKLRTVPGAFSERERQQKDISQATTLIAKLEAESSDSRGSAAIARHIAAFEDADGADPSVTVSRLLASREFLSSGLNRPGNTLISCCNTFDSVFRPAITAPLCMTSRKS